MPTRYLNILQQMQHLPQNSNHSTINNTFFLLNNFYTANQQCKAIDKTKAQEFKLNRTEKK